MDLDFSPSPTGDTPEENLEEDAATEELAGKRKRADVDNSDDDDDEEHVSPELCTWRVCPLTLSRCRRCRSPQALRSSPRAPGWRCSTESGPCSCCGAVRAGCQWAVAPRVQVPSHHDPTLQGHPNPGSLFPHLVSLLQGPPQHIELCNELPRRCSLSRRCRTLSHCARGRYSAVCV